jgi:hypothetical protein
MRNPNATTKQMMETVIKRICLVVRDTCLQSFLAVVTDEPMPNCLDDEIGDGTVSESEDKSGTRVH